MPAYDTPIRKEYTFNAVNLGAAFTRNIRGPFGKRGRVVRMALMVTASLTGASNVATVTTTVAPVPGSPYSPTPAAATVVFSWTIPNATAPAGLVSDGAAGVATPNNTLRDVNNNTFILPANADVVFAITAGGAGTADINLEIDWFDA